MRVFECERSHLYEAYQQESIVNVRSKGDYLVLLGCAEIYFTVLDCVSKNHLHDMTC